MAKIDDESTEIIKKPVQAKPEQDEMDDGAHPADFRRKDIALLGVTARGAYCQCKGLAAARDIFRPFGSAFARQRFSQLEIFLYPLGEITEDRGLPACGRLWSAGCFREPRGHRQRD